MASHDPDDVRGARGEELPRGVFDRMVVEPLGERLEDSGLGLGASLAVPAEDPPVDRVLEETPRLPDVEPLHQLRQGVEPVAVGGEGDAQQLDEPREHHGSGIDDMVEGLGFHAAAEEDRAMGVDREEERRLVAQVETLGDDVTQGAVGGPVGLELGDAFDGDVHGA